MDIDSGEILALVSSPSYESNNFVSGISNHDWKELLNNPGKPMTNKTISTQYPPGSTFKTIVALAALENNFDPNTKFTCEGKTRLGRRKFHCWKEKGHGEVNLVTAIERSCNVYFYNLSREIGINNIVNVAKEFGLGAAIDIPLPNTKKGFLPTKEWKKNFFGIPWVLGDTFNSSIGQGFVETTGLLLAVLTARLASKGKKVVPSLFKLDTQPIFEDLPFSKENIEIVLEGMFRVVNKRNGTAYYRRIRKKQFRMSGKTGTAQVIATDHSKNKNKDDIEFEKRNHGLFIGFAPFDKPKYAISVIVEHGGSGSGSAAPLAQKLLYKIQKTAVEKHSSA